jgi:ribosomal-protein-alanine N-acetyltransferase
VLSALRSERETERLVLRPWTYADLEPFAELCSDPFAMRFITGGEPIPRAAIGELSARSVRMWEEHGFGPWAVTEKRNGSWIGRIGLNLLHDWPEPHRWEIGFELIPRSWGCGLATEGAREGLRFGFREVKLERIIGVTAADHRAARRVMEKCGLSFRGETRFRGARVAWCALDRERFDSSATALEDEPSPST